MAKTNQIKTRFGTPVIWTDAASGGTKLMDLGGLAAGGIVIGAFLDLGQTPRPTLYSFELLIDGFDTAPVVNEVLSFKFAQSDSQINFDGVPSTDPTAIAQGVITVNQSRNIGILGGVLIVNSTTAGDKLKISGVVELFGRFVAPVVHNKTADALLSTSDTHILTLVPLIEEIQEAS